MDNSTTVEVENPIVPKETLNSTRKIIINNGEATRKSAAKKKLHVVNLLQSERRRKKTITATQDMLEDEEDPLNKRNSQRLVVVDIKQQKRPKIQHDQMYASKDVDQGWAWLIMVCSFFGCFITAGMCYSFGVYYTEYLIRFPDQKILISILTGLPSALFLILGPVSVYCAKTIGYHWTVVIGCSVGTIGYLISYCFVDNLRVLCFAHGFLVGTGGGLLYSPIVCVLKLCFIRRYVLATAFALSGIACGCLAFPFIYHILIGRMGFKRSLLINAIIYLHMFLIAAVLAKPRRRDSNEENGDDETNWATAEAAKLAMTQRKESMLNLSRKSSIIVLTAPPVMVSDIINTLVELEAEESAFASTSSLDLEESVSSKDSNDENNHHYRSDKMTEKDDETIVGADNNTNKVEGPLKKGTLIVEKVCRPSEEVILPRPDCMVQQDKKAMEPDSVPTPETVKIVREQYDWKSSSPKSCNSGATSSPSEYSFTTYPHSSELSRSLLPHQNNQGLNKKSTATLLSSPSYSGVKLGGRVDGQQKTIRIRSFRTVLFVAYAPFEQASCIIILIMISKFAQSLGIDAFRSSTLISWVGIGELCGCLSIVLWGFYYSSSITTTNQGASGKKSVGKIQPSDNSCINSKNNDETTSLDNGSVHTGIFFMTALVIQTIVSGIFILNLSQAYVYFCGLTTTFGYFYGVRIALLNTLIIDVFGSKNFTFIYSAYFFVAGIGCLLSLPLATWISTALSNAFAMFYITTTTFVLCVILLSIATFDVYRRKWSSSNKPGYVAEAQNHSVSSSELFAVKHDASFTHLSNNAINTKAKNCAIV